MCNIRKTSIDRPVVPTCFFTRKNYPLGKALFGGIFQIPKNGETINFEFFLCESNIL